MLERLSKLTLVITLWTQTTLMMNMTTKERKKSLAHSYPKDKDIDQIQRVVEVHIGLAIKHGLHLGP